MEKTPQAVAIRHDPETDMQTVTLSDGTSFSYNLTKAKAALRTIADGTTDSGGNRRNHPDATMIARSALGRED